MPCRILVINPGSTSTKIAVYLDKDKIFETNIEHSKDDLASYDSVFEQKEYRMELVKDALVQSGIKYSDIDVVIGRGGLGKPIEGGIYSINDAMLEDVSNCTYGEHPANLGPVIAKEIADDMGVPALVMDPVSVDEMEPVARLSGLKELPRISMMHTLNSRAVARKFSEEMGKKYEDLNFVVAHLGAGISITPHTKGRIVDCNNTFEGGPMCPDRAGGLPSKSLVQLCYSGKYKDAAALIKKMTREGGISDHLQTKDLRIVEKMVREGDEYAGLVLQAMVYQIAKEIGAMSTVLKGDVDYIIITGGMAFSEGLVKDITDRVKSIAPVVVRPGENELEALAFGALRAMQGEETIKTYK